MLKRITELKVNNIFYIAGMKSIKNICFLLDGIGSNWYDYSQIKNKWTHRGFNMNTLVFIHKPNLLINHIWQL